MSDVPGWWDDDDRLIAELGAAVRDGAAVPESFLLAGRAAYAWRTAEAELAELRFDSWTAPPQPAGLRAEPGTPPQPPEHPMPGHPTPEQRTAEPRALSFAAAELAIEVEIHPDAVRGQIAPAQPGTVRVRDVDGPVREAPVDEVGWFVVAPVPPGRFRLHIRTAAGGSVLTGWIGG